MAPRKPNQPTLTREQIVAASIAIVDRDGLAGLSMRKLASELGMSPMSLYYHVPDKSALNDHILDAVMGEVDTSIDDPAQPVEERAIVMARAVRQALLAHPNAVSLALSRSLHTPLQLRPIEKILGILFDGGLSPTDALAAVNIVGQYILGTAAACANRMAAPEIRDAVHEADLSELTQEAFPHMVRVTRESEHLGFEGEFELGLRILVRGLLP